MLLASSYYINQAVITVIDVFPAVKCSIIVCCGCLSKQGGDPLFYSQDEPVLGTQGCICKLEGPRPWMSPAPARKRSDTPSVKHGCALEEGKMLNCVGISREKQQTWLDWLTILLSWDTIRRKPVSLAAGRLAEWTAKLRFVVQAVSQCVMMLMLDSFALSFTLATQLPGETGNNVLIRPITGQIVTIIRPVCVYRLRSRLMPSHPWLFAHYALRYLTWINRNFFTDSKMCHILSLLIVTLSGPGAGFTSS